MCARIPPSESLAPGYLGALLIVVMAPFDTLEPVVALPGQNLTSLEVVLGSVLGLWGAHTLWRGGWRGLPGTHLLVPLAALWAVLVLSALFSSGGGTHSWRFVGRFAALILVYLLVTTVAVSGRRVWTLVGAAVLSSLVVSLVGLLESLQDPSTLHWLTLFREELFLVGVQPRISSTLQYPTIAAMFLEITFCWSMGLLLKASLGRRLSLLLPLVAVQVLIGSAVVLTLTRAGWAVLFLALLLAALMWRRGAGSAEGSRRGVHLLGVVGFLLATVCLLTLGGDPEARLRWTTLDQSQWYQADYDVPRELTLKAGEEVVIPITITNRGVAPWGPGGEAPFRLSYHWYSASGDTVVDYEGVRTSLSGLVPPGQAVTLQARVRAPLSPGDYLLVWDMLREHRFWFSRETSGDGRSRVRVSGPGAGSGGASEAVPGRRFLVGRLELWSAAAGMLLEHPLLGVGPDSFRFRYGDSIGAAPADPIYHTHNLVIEFFVNTGLVGGILLLWVMARVLGLLKQWGRRGSNPALQVCLCCAAGVILAHGMFDYFLGFTPAYVMIAATLGLVEAGNRLAGDEDRPRSG